MARKAKVRLITACLIALIFMIGEVIGELLKLQYCTIYVYSCSWEVATVNNVVCNLIGQGVTSKSHSSVVLVN